MTQLNDLFECNRYVEVLLTPALLNDFRLQIKNILLFEKVLCEEDFYQAPKLNYLPQKSTLKKRLDFKNTFNQTLISNSISIAHQRDESFHQVTQAGQLTLSHFDRKFSCLIILASGSGQLATHLLSNLKDAEIKKIGHQVYSVDISHTMSTHGVEKFSKNSDFSKISHFPVTTDCVLFENLKSEISELSQNLPILAISHGGARYFAEERESHFIETVSAFPKDSRIIITEVGAEMYQLMSDLAYNANSNRQLEVLTFPSNNTSGYHCWNLSYYYFLMQQYTQSVSFRSFIDDLIKPICTKNIDASSDQNYLNCVNFIFLEIAGTRKQPVYLLELHCR